MEEIDLYKLKEWGLPEWIDGGEKFPKWCNTLLIDLSHNPHFMAANILYANFGVLDASFTSWFHLQDGTIFLYEKLMDKFKNEVSCNHQSALKYFYLKEYRRTLVEGKLAYQYIVSHTCEIEPMSNITFPYEDLSWFSLAKNPHRCVIEFLKKHRYRINWAKLSENSSDAAVEFLLQERRNIVWWNASSNTNQRILALFEEEKTNLSEYRLSKNPSDTAVRFLLDNPDVYENISWASFCQNPNDHAIDHIISILSEDRNDKRIIWTSLCENVNPRILDILRDNKEKIVWSSFVKNPTCFNYNYEMMRKRCLPIKQEIEAIFMRPENVMAIIERAREGDEDDFDVISRLNKLES